MGLADRKVKQKIQADPRNLAWKNDASRFGHAYLSKLGWSSGATLGLTGQGLTDYIRVAHKLDALGIGAKVGGKEDRDGRAGREFDGLLRRLNSQQQSAEAGEEGEGEGEGDVRVEETIRVRGFHRANGEEGVSVEDRVVVEETKGKGKKRKRSGSDASSSSSESDSDSDAEEKTVTTTTTTTTTTVSTTTPASAVPRRLAHRSRFLRAKSLAKSDSRAVSEILGIASAPASLPGTPSLRSGDEEVPAAFPTLSGTSTPRLAAPGGGSDGKEDGKAQEGEKEGEEEEEKEEEMIKVSTSTLSVADYFKQKMRAKLGLSAPASGDSSPQASGASTPPEGGEKRDEQEDERQGMGLGMGLGFGRGLGAGRGLGFRPAIPKEEEPVSRQEGLEERAAATSLKEVEAITEAEKPAKKEKKKKRKESSQLEADSAPASTSVPQQPVAETNLPDAVGSSSKEKESKKKRKHDDALAAWSQPAPEEGERKKKKKKHVAESETIAEPSEVPSAPVEGEKKEKKKKRKHELENEGAPAEPASVVPADEAEKKKKKKKRSEEAAPTVAPIVPNNAPAPAVDAEGKEKKKKKRKAERDAEPSAEEQRAVVEGERRKKKKRKTSEA